MKISVIIPVYNAERFVRKAAESALKQKETGEVLLIEDGSPDQSLRVCLELEKQYRRIKLLRHAGGANKGAGATRNLGISQAKYAFVAFLDADDYYLPNRFASAARLIEEDSRRDGVYEAIGMHFYDPLEKERWLSSGGELLTTLRQPVDPEHLFRSLLTRKNGYIHLDGLVVRRSLIDRSGNFPENLRLHQDTAFIIQLAALGQLVHGNLETPVALRGIHSNNRITHNRNVYETRYLLWDTLLSWASGINIEFGKKVLIHRKYMQACYQYHKYLPSPRQGKLRYTSLFFAKLIRHPFLFLCSAPNWILHR